MDADLDLLLTSVFVTADDLLPVRQNNAARSVTDAEVVTLCVAQAIMGIPSDRRFLAVAGKRLDHLFYDDLLLIDSTPVECARSRETVKRSQLADAADYGYCQSHGRFFWGFRLHAIFAPDGTPRALELVSPKIDEREIGLVLLDRVRRHGGETLLGDKGYAGRAFAAGVAERGATLVRPRRKDETGHGPHLAPIRQRIESIFWTCKDLLTLERHGDRTLPGLRERVLARFCCLAAAITLNHQLGRPSRALVNYCA
jgi:hypothetical protein